MSDEGYREIQLNGKQLVFLFMSATVVSVVIFLCGVMVGRGVQAQQRLVAAAAQDVVTDPTIIAPPASSVAATAGTTDAPISTQETLTYAERLAAPDPPLETLREPSPPPRPAAAEPAPPPPAARPRTPARAAAAVTASRAPSEPAGNGFVVQVAAVRERREADTIARRLSSKGYPAFVTTPAGVARVFRVRVGKYPTRREADAIAARLQKEEQFKPWITK
jgi:cell division septation protein DedD